MTTPPRRLVRAHRHPLTPARRALVVAAAVLLESAPLLGLLDRLGG